MSGRLALGVHVTVFPAGESLFRIHPEDKGPLWFGPAVGALPMGRWDAPHGEYKICYCGVDLTSSFAETILHRTGVQQITRDALYQRSWSEIRCLRDMRLAHFCDNGLAKHGLTAADVSDLDYDQTQALALEAFKADPTLDGVLYRSVRNNGHLCAALFDRVAKDELWHGKPTRFVDWGEANWRKLLTDHGARLEGDTRGTDDTETLIQAEPDFVRPPR